MVFLTLGIKKKLTVDRWIIGVQRFSFINTVDIFVYQNENLFANHDVFENTWQTFFVFIAFSRVITEKLAFKDDSDSTKNKTFFSVFPLLESLNNDPD